LLLAIAAAALSFAPAAAQSDSIRCDTPRELRCEPMALDAFVARCEAQLDGRHDTTLTHGTPRQLAGATLGWLRLGRGDRAHATLQALAQRAEEGDHDANAWWLVARFWALRAMAPSCDAFHEPRRILAAARLLATECARTENPPPLARHALCVHAIACASELLIANDDATHPRVRCRGIQRAPRLGNGLTHEPGVFGAGSASCSRQHPHLSHWLAHWPLTCACSA
jgi:hypothetical protein